MISWMGNWKLLVKDTYICRGLMIPSQLAKILTKIWSINFMVYKIWAVLLLPKNRILSRVTLKSFSFSFLWHQTRNFKTSKHIAVLQQFLYKYVFFSFTQRDVKEGGGDLVGASLLSIMLVAVTVQEKFLSFPDKDVFSHGDSHVYQTGKRLTQVFQCHFDSISSNLLQS